MGHNPPIIQPPFQGPKFIILNTDESDGRGLHWTANNVSLIGPLEFFDPLCKSPESYRGYLRDWLVSCKINGDIKITALIPVESFASTTVSKDSRGETLRQIVQTSNARNLTYKKLHVSDFVCILVWSIKLNLSPSPAPPEKKICWSVLSWTVGLIPTRWPGWNSYNDLVGVMCRVRKKKTATLTCSSIPNPSVLWNLTTGLPKRSEFMLTQSLKWCLLQRGRNDAYFKEV